MSIFSKNYINPLNSFEDIAKEYGYKRKRNKQWGKKGDWTLSLETKLKVEDFE